MKPVLPQAVVATLWSYDTTKMDIEKDKERIITNVLNYGTDEANQWLFQTYSRVAIEKVAKHPRPGEWNKKSLNFWSVVFNSTPEITTRF